MATVAENYFQGALEERKRLLAAAMAKAAPEERLSNLFD